MLESAKFSDVVRYRHAPYWAKGNKVQDFLDSQSDRHLESDAEHSWQVADMVLLLGPHFPELDLGKALMMAILHDKVEIFTGDAVATGLSGDGSDSHAFNNEIKQVRHRQETIAREKYLASLAPATKRIQKRILAEYETKLSAEARFVDALDKLQTLIWTLYCQKSNLSELAGTGAIEFSEKYKKPRIAKFPGLLPYYEEAIDRIKKGMALKLES